MKPCSECHKPLIRISWESDANWKKRKTCGGKCRLARQARRKREAKLGTHHDLTATS